MPSKKPHSILDKPGERVYLCAILDGPPQRPPAVAPCSRGTCEDGGSEAKLSASRQFLADSVEGSDQLPPASAYPTRQAPAKDESPACKACGGSGVVPPNHTVREHGRYACGHWPSCWRCP